MLYIIQYSSTESSSTDSISSVSITSPSPQPTSAAAAIRGGEGGRVSVVRNRVRNKSVTINTEPTDEDEYPSTDRQTNFNDIIRNPKELEFFKVLCSLQHNSDTPHLYFLLCMYVVCTTFVHLLLKSEEFCMSLHYNAH